MPRYHFPEPPARLITPPARGITRRTVMTGLGAATLAAAMPRSGWTDTLAADPWPGSATDTLTSREVATGYNNFFEFGTSKSDPAEHAHHLNPTPWQIEVSGHAHDPGVIGMEDILSGFDLEERIYRLRCVEGWSKVIPWIGFPLKQLLARFDPTSDAQYVEFETLHDPVQMPNQTGDDIDWPYREGLRMDEAMHPLTLLAVGMYGEVMPNQNGAPIRLVVPWKYGFKSIKSIVRIRLVSERPVSSWEALAPREYGFYANVNPEVRHPRWHQATERRLHDGGRIATEKFNGYGEQVAHLYEGMDLFENF
jgi:sulfoxide reductase catalytic subunit YedY